MADLALVMSHVNSESRGALGFATPARAFRAMLGEDAAALLDAYGVGDVPLGDLDLTPGLIEEARAERAMPHWPSLEEKRNRRTDRSAEFGKRYRAAGRAWPPDLSNTFPPFLQLGKCRPRVPDGASGGRLTAGVSHQLNVVG